MRNNLLVDILVKMCIEKMQRIYNNQAYKQKQNFIFLSISTKIPTHTEINRVKERVFKLNILQIILTTSYKVCTAFLTANHIKPSGIKLN